MTFKISIFNFVLNGLSKNILVDFRPASGAHVYRSQLPRYIALLFKIVFQVSKAWVVKISHKLWN